jgi:hypothetical protein
MEYVPASSVTNNPIGGGGRSLPRLHEELDPDYAALVIQISAHAAG